MFDALGRQILPASPTKCSHGVPIDCVCTECGRLIGGRYLVDGKEISKSEADKHLRKDTYGT